MLVKFENPASANKPVWVNPAFVVGIEETNPPTHNAVKIRVMAPGTDNDHYYWVKGKLDEVADKIRWAER
jgi:hypothetical protein